MADLIRDDMTALLILFFITLLNIAMTWISIRQAKLTQDMIREALLKEDDNDNG